MEGAKWGSHRAKITIVLYMYLHTRLEGNKSNKSLKTSFSYGLTLTVHFLDDHFILSLLKKKLTVEYIGPALPPLPSFHLFSLAPFFARPECENSFARPEFRSPRTRTLSTQAKVRAKVNRVCVTTEIA